MKLGRGFLSGCLKVRRWKGIKMVRERLTAITKTVAHLNPTCSYITPATAGPTKPPKENEHLQIDVMIPYVSRLSSSPADCAVLIGSVNPAIYKPPVPRP